MENQKPLKEKVSITLDNNIIKEIKELAYESDRSFSQYINLVLKKPFTEETFIKAGSVCCLLFLCKAK